MTTAHAPFQVMAKPIGPRCNLDCAYCYYLEKEDLYPEERGFRMTDAVLERLIADTMASQRTPEILFAWQGGEPTLLGLDFFRRVVALQERLCPPGRTVTNALQTNGTLIDADWAEFLCRHRFLVGVSIDGPRELHDRYRTDRRQRPTFEKVMQGIELLKEHGVDFNALVVVHRHNVRHPGQVYRFLKEIGVEFMQFIPVVERKDASGALAEPPTPDQDEPPVRVTPWSVTPEAYGKFLCRVFDRWLQGDVGRVFVQLFDVQLMLWMGGPAQLCWFAETCGDALALEHNGDLYACDHYVYPGYRLGNILDTSLADLARSPVQRRFGQQKRDGLPGTCRKCEYRFACNGGCPKHRFLATTDGEPGLNYFCAAYKRFFAHAGPQLRTMADLAARGQPPALVSEVLGRGSAPRPGRNDPCPCGSGRKFKACCGVRESIKSNIGPTPRRADSRYTSSPRGE
jgi:uncharacterized protein